jgi:hypothetical protein
MRGYRFIRVVALLGMALIFAAHSATAQNSVGSRPHGKPSDSFKPQAVSTEHLYWHFLMHLQRLDAKAAEMTAQGKDGSGLRNDLQSRLKFSDADFALLRASAQRLSSQLTAINEKAKALTADSTAATQNRDQLRALHAERETVIHKEVLGLQQTIPLEKQASLEAFLIQFFAPKQLPATITATKPSQGAHQ